MTLYRLWEPANHQLAWTMNMISVHTSYSDSFEETLISSSDLSFMFLSKCTYALIFTKYVLKR